MCLCLTKMLLLTPYPNFPNNTDQSEVFSKLLQVLLAPEELGEQWYLLSPLVT